MTGCINNSSSKLVNNSGMTQKAQVENSNIIPVRGFISIYSYNDLLLVSGYNEIFQGIIQYSNNAASWHASSLFPNTFPKTINSITSDNNGNIISVGLYGNIYRSTNEGISWTEESSNAHCGDKGQYTCNLFGVTAYKNMFVAVGDFGTIITSANGGKSWKQEKSNTTNGLQSITVDKNGYFIAVGLQGNVVTSSDGIHWQNNSIPDKNSLRSVAINKSGIIVAVGDYATYLSTDGGIVWWQTSKLNNLILRSVTVNQNGRFVAVGDSGIVYMSDDGDSWSKCISGTDTNLYGITYSKKHKLFIAVGENPQKIIVSSDGIVWGESINLKEITNYCLMDANSICYPAIIKENEITAFVSPDTKLNNLVPRFTYNGKSITVNGKPQINNETNNNFDAPVIYKIHAENNTTKEYKVSAANYDDKTFAYIVNNPNNGNKYTGHSLIKCMVNLSDGNFYNCKDTGINNIVSGISQAYNLGNASLLIADYAGNKIVSCTIEQNGDLTNCKSILNNNLYQPTGISIGIDPYFDTILNISNYNYYGLYGYITTCYYSYFKTIINCDMYNTNHARHYSAVVQNNQNRYIYFLISGPYLDKCQPNLIEHICTTTTNSDYLGGITFRDPNLLYVTTIKNHGVCLYNINDMSHCKQMLTNNELEYPLGISFLNNRYAYISDFGKFQNGNGFITKCDVDQNSGDLSNNCNRIIESSIANSPIDVKFANTNITDFSVSWYDANSNYHTITVESTILDNNEPHLITIAAHNIINCNSENSYTSNLMFDGNRIVINKIYGDNVSVYNDLPVISPASVKLHADPKNKCGNITIEIQKFNG